MDTTHHQPTRLLWLVIASSLACASTPGQEKEAVQEKKKEAVTTRKVVLPRSITKNVLLRSAILRLDTLPNDWREHPLAPALLFAVKHHQHIEENVRDFSCILVKRERINGRLRPYEYLQTKVRREQTNDGTVIVPFAAYAEYLAPRKVRGRRVLYVDGQNDNKLVVRNGGQRFNYVTVRIAPDSDAVKREANYPITELGLSNVVSRLIEQVQDDIEADPEAKNTEVSFFSGAKIDDRPCTHIRVTHDKESPALDFHLANVYVDDELKVPIRVEGYGWPKNDGDKPPLLEEYTYTRLKLNVGLTDADFDLKLISE